MEGLEKLEGIACSKTISKGVNPMPPIWSILDLYKGQGQSFWYLKSSFLTSFLKAFLCLDFYIPPFLMIEDDMGYEILRSTPEFLKAGYLSLL